MTDTLSLTRTCVYPTTTGGICTQGTRRATTAV
jgi:hypothetical protein